MGNGVQRGRDTEDDSAGLEPAETGVAVGAVEEALSQDAASPEVLISQSNGSVSNLLRWGGPCWRSGCGV